jgi:hypothetical protein
MFAQILNNYEWNLIENKGNEKQRREEEEEKNTR